MHPNISFHRAMLTAVVASVTLGAAAWANHQPPRPDGEGGRHGCCVHHRAPFSAIYVFGDSLSDTWRADEAFDSTPPAVWPWLNPTIHEGRMCNGPLWIEYLAPALGMTYVPQYNYAFAGATTGRENFFDPDGALGLPGMLDQLDDFLVSLDPAVGADPEALYVVAGGSNNFFRVLQGATTPEAAATQVVTDLVTIVATLRAVGAQHIVLWDVPDVSTIPLMQGFEASAPGTKAAVRDLCAVTNEVLGETLAANGLDVVVVSIFDMVGDWTSSPRRYGFVNISDPAIPDLNLARHYLFWDEIHPSSRTQAWIALGMFEALDDAGLVAPGRRFGHWLRRPFACGRPRG